MHAPPYLRRINGSVQCVKRPVGVCDVGSQAVQSMYALPDLEHVRPFFCACAHCPRGRYGGDIRGVPVYVRGCFWSHLVGSCAQRTWGGLCYEILSDSSSSDSCQRLSGPLLPVCLSAHLHPCVRLLYVLPLRCLSKFLLGHISPAVSDLHGICRSVAFLAM